MVCRISYLALKPRNANFKMLVKRTVVNECIAAASIRVKCYKHKAIIPLWYLNGCQQLSGVIKFSQAVITATATEDVVSLVWTHLSSQVAIRKLIPAETGGIRFYIDWIWMHGRKVTGALMIGVEFLLSCVLSHFQVILFFPFKKPHFGFVTTWLHQSNLVATDGGIKIPTW